MRNFIEDMIKVMTYGGMVLGVIGLVGLGFLYLATEGVDQIVESDPPVCEGSTRLSSSLACIPYEPINEELRGTEIRCPKGEKRVETPYTVKCKRRQSPEQQRLHDRGIYYYDIDRAPGNKAGEPPVIRAEP